jgi:hypothetical protein
MFWNTSSEHFFGPHFWSLGSVKCRLGQFAIVKNKLKETYLFHLDVNIKWLYKAKKMRLES